MLCCICKERNATVHYTKIDGDKVQKVDLCEECSKTKGVNDPVGFELADLLLGLGASKEIEQSSGGADLKLWGHWIWISSGAWFPLQFP